MNRLLVAAVFGFAFVAVWRFGGFDSALMCALGAVVAILAVLLVDGELDVRELRARLRSRRGDPRQSAGSTTSTITAASGERRRTAA
jgi:hypothetical protein